MASELPPNRMPQASVCPLLVKALYVSMLVEWPLERIRGFWGGAANEAELAGSEQDFFKSVWDEAIEMPYPQWVRAIGSLESFLAAEQRDHRAFLARTLSRLLTDTPAFSRLVLSAFASEFEKLFRASDPRAFILSRGSRMLERLFPLVSRDSFAAPEVTGIHSILLLASHPHRLRSPGYDPTLVEGGLIAYLPVLFSLPSAQLPRPLVDPRRPEDVVWEHGVVYRRNRLLIGGISYGELIPLKSLLKRLGWGDYMDGGSADDVVQMERDYFCPRRRRIVLRAGTAYGAPFHLVQLSWRPDFGRPANLLGRVLEDVTDPPRDHLWQRMQCRHSDLLGAVRRRLVMVYHRETGKLTINDRMLTRDTPARILKKIVRLHLETGRQEFEHREFIEDREITLDPLNPSLVIRLKRLSEALRKSGEAIEIDKSGRGKISFRSDFPLEFREE